MAGKLPWVKEQGMGMVRQYEMRGGHPNVSGYSAHISSQIVFPYPYTIIP